MFNFLVKHVFPFGGRDGGREGSLIYQFNPQPSTIPYLLHTKYPAKADKNRVHMPQSIETARGQFSYRTYGEASKPPLMLVHGWPQTSYCWHHMAPYLNDFYVIAPDLRGMGDSNRELDTKCYTKDQMLEDLFAVADALGIETFHLGGHD